MTHMTDIPKEDKIGESIGLTNASICDESLQFN